MSIIKLPSGSYNVRKMVEGKSYSLTFDHRPTKKEIDIALNKRLTGNKNGKKSFEYCAREYIADRSNTLSPATTQSYQSRLKVISQTFKDLEIDKIVSRDVQKEINRFADGHAPKTVKNLYLFIRSVLCSYRDDLVLKVKLPALEVKPPYIPNKKDINALLEYYKDTQMELVIRLACLGLRRGEICALSLSDLQGNYLTINKDKVPNSSNEWVIKSTPKTSSSNRVIYVSDRIVELAKTVGFFEGNPNTIYVWLTRAQEKLGIEHFSIHKCRHYFASVALEQMPEADVMRFGGWGTDQTMKRIYRHTLTDRTKDVSKVISDSLI